VSYSQVGAAVQEGSPSELTRAHAKSNQPVGRFGVLYSDYRSDPTRPVNSAAREDAMTTASLSSSSQEVFDYGWAVAARSQWNSAEASVLPRQVLQDSTGTPASIILDDMLEKPPSLSYSRPSAPGIPPRVLEGSHFKWASQKSNDEPELERVRPELERVRRQPGSWANGSYLEEANRQRGDSGHAASLSGSAAVSTQAKPRVTVPKLWREGALGALCVCLPGPVPYSRTFSIYRQHTTCTGQLCQHLRCLQGASRCRRGQRVFIFRRRHLLWWKEGVKVVHECRETQHGNMITISRHERRLSNCRMTLKNLTLSNGLRDEPERLSAPSLRTLSATDKRGNQRRRTGC